MTALKPALDQAVTLIEEFEGIEVEAYLDPIGIPTICAGLTKYPSGAPVRMGDVCSKEVCRGYLIDLLKAETLPALERIPGWHRLNGQQQAVLMSFAWNLGADFYGSPGFETLTQALKDGASNPAAYLRVPRALGLYVNAGGRAWPGLIARRQKEGETWRMATNEVVAFEALQDTVLKSAPIDRALLSPLGLQSIEKGELVSVSRVEEIPANAHVWFTLAGEGTRWAAYGPHWETQRNLAAIEAHKSATPPAAPKPGAPVDWSDFGALVGRYITVGELLQYDKRRRPAPGSQVEKNLLSLCRQFDGIRQSWNGPIGVTSGYRPEPINSQVGGVPNSRHVSGEALDIYPIGESLEKFHQWLIQRWTGGYGDGRRRGFIHIDTRNNGLFHHQAGVRPAVIWDY